MKKYSSMCKILITVIICLIIIPTLLNAQQRKIKPGDTIEIIVYGHQELSRTVDVSPQGTVDFPFMQNIPVDGQTLEKIRELIVARLKLILPATPVVTASFVKTSNISVNVLGHVGTPGVVELKLNSRLQGAIFQAGNFLPGAISKSVTLIRNEKGETITNTYNLELFIFNGDLQENPVLSDEDIIVVTGNPIFAQVKVLGSVTMPGTYIPLHGASVIDMIFMAGGFTEVADLAKVKYISTVDEKSLELEIDMRNFLESLQSIANLPIVKEGDIIFVPKKKINILMFSWGVIKEILPIAQTVFWIYYITQRY